jgi:NADPH-dependent curcumin reductase CurA
MTVAPTNPALVLRGRPTGLVGDTDVELVELPVPAVGDGQVLIRNRYLAIDPTTRAGMDAAPTYEPPMVLGEPVRALGVGEIVESRSEAMPVGALVLGYLGWQTWCVTAAEGLHAVPEGVTPTSMLSGLGPAGLAAYFAMMDVAPAAEGQTVVISSAAGSVGSVAGQIARIQGARVVGIAGGPTKCAYVTDELGFDACVDRFGDDLDEQLAKACPQGIDVYLDNVGGPILQTVLGQLNVGARVAMAGTISAYAASEPVPGPTNLLEIVNRRVTIQGLLVTDYLERVPEAVFQLAIWEAEGKLTYRYELVPGLAAAPSALNRLFTGDHRGKPIVALDGIG